MHIPDVQSPTALIASIRAAVKATIDDAVRLGLVWRLRPGTVGGTGAANPHAVPVVVDGDNAQILGRSWVGGVSAGQRVWCLFVPPAGVYVVGTIGDRIEGQPLVQAGTVAVTPVTEITAGTSIYDGSYWRGSTAVTFDTPYSSAPVITVSPSSSVPGFVIETSHSSVSTTGFTAWVARSNTTNTTVHWHAVGSP